MLLFFLCAHVCKKMTMSLCLVCLEQQRLLSVRNLSGVLDTGQTAAAAKLHTLVHSADDVRKQPRLLLFPPAYLDSRLAFKSC